MPPIEDDDLDTGDRGDDFEPTDDAVEVGTPEPELVIEDEIPAPKAKVDVENEPNPVVADADVEDEDEPTPKEHMIPKGRFDEVNAKRRIAEARIAELEAAAAATTRATEEGEADTFDFDTKEDELTAALIDGDAALAKSLRSEIRAAERAQITRDIEATAIAKATETLTKSQAKSDADGAVADINKAYPIFDPESETFDQDLTNEAIAMARGYQSQGYTFPDALKKAVGNLAKLNDLTAEGEQKPATRASVDVGKTQAKLDAANQQPPKNKGSAIKEAATDPENMTDAEWDALPPATKKRLRGDL